MLQYIGIELEGAWKESLGNRPGTETSDSSVAGFESSSTPGAATSYRCICRRRRRAGEAEMTNCPCREYEEHGDCSRCMEASSRHRFTRYGFQWIGEFISPPMPILDYPSWLETCYPDEVNRSCGLHFHVSFQDQLAYSRLISKEFSEKLQKDIYIWGRDHLLRTSEPEFFDRLEGKNSTCRPKYDAKQQLSHKGKYHSERYRAVNFCFPLHQTIEFRYLPAFKEFKTAILAIDQSLLIIKRYIRDHQKREKALIIRV